MRPIYETRGHRANELAALYDWLWTTGRLYEVAIMKMPHKDAVDYMLTSGDGARMLVEVKARNGISTRYADYMVGLSKWNGITERAHDLRVELGGWLLAAFDEMLFWCQPVNLTPDYVKAGGRTDRNDPRDIEPMAHLAWGRFHKTAPRRSMAVDWGLRP